MAHSTSQLLLVGAVAAVGVLHTSVPDHWVPITLVARQRGWSYAQTARAALLAGTGHVVSTLLIAILVWGAGVAAAKTFGNLVDTLASLALIAFGGWIAISSLWAMRSDGHGHGHAHSHGLADANALGIAEGVHGPELQLIQTDEGIVYLSIYEAGIPPHFRLTGGDFSQVTVTTIRPDGAEQVFGFIRSGDFWQSRDAIPEPHGFDVALEVTHGGHAHTYQTEFAEHEHGHEHGHGRHGHGDHDHHGHSHAVSGAGSRTLLLLIVGSSPMVEGIPAFFAAGRYGAGLILTMSLVFAATTIATYVLLCLASVAGLRRVSLGPLEKYGEVLSGAFIALIGVVFLLWPVL